MYGSGQHIEVCGLLQHGETLQPFQQITAGAALLNRKLSGLKLTPPRKVGTGVFHKTSASEAGVQQC